MITDPDRVKAWVGAERVPADVFDDAWGAAERYVTDRVSPRPDDETTPPADLVLAVNLLTSRYLARRNSPDGMVGLGDLGTVQVPFADADVKRLLAPYLPVVFG